MNLVSSCSVLKFQWLMAFWYFFFLSPFNIRENKHGVSKWIGWWDVDDIEREKNAPLAPVDTNCRSDWKWIRFPGTSGNNKQRKNIISLSFHLYLIARIATMVTATAEDTSPEDSSWTYRVASFPRQLWRWITNYLQLFSRREKISPFRQRVHMSLFTLNTLLVANERRVSKKSSSVAAVVCLLLPRV